MHGVGRLQSANGDYYEGEFKHHKYHGVGTFTKANGDKFMGFCENGMASGLGVLALGNGEKYKGNSIATSVTARVYVLTQTEPAMLGPGTEVPQRVSEFLSLPMAKDTSANLLQAVNMARGGISSSMEASMMVPFTRTRQRVSAYTTSLVGTSTQATGTTTSETERNV